MVFQVFIVVCLIFAKSFAESEVLPNVKIDINKDIKELNHEIQELEKFVTENQKECEGKIQTLNNKLNSVSSTTDNNGFATRCQSGTFSAHTHPVAPRWPVTKNIKFNVPYSKAPALTYGMYVLDSEWNTNIRALASVKNLDGRGFNLQLTTWAGTKQWGVGVSWMVCPSA